jgi:large subunit ribosomal protein L1
MPNKKRGKRYRAAAEKVQKPSYPLVEAVQVLKQYPAAKFDETVDVAFRLNVDPKHADQMVRGSVVLPKGTGKKIRIAVVASGEKMKEAQDAGADAVGGKDLIDKIREGWLEFDALVATPDIMGEVGKLGKVLGPRGLMPSPKTGTATFDVRQAIEQLRLGKINYRVDKAGNVHAPIGKLSFAADDLTANAEAVLQAVLRDRPAAVKGNYIKGLTVSSTMGPGVRVDLAGAGN